MIRPALRLAALALPLVALPLLAAACAAPAAASAPASASAPAPAPAPAAASAPAARARPEGLAIAVTPRVTPDIEVEVEVIASSEAPGALARWSIARKSGAIRILDAADDAGPLAVAIAPHVDAGLRLELSRPPRGAVRLRYVIAGAPLSAAPVPDVEADPDRFRASGDALLALPDAFEDRAVPVSLRIGVDAIGDAIAARGAASSFGAGAHREFTARGGDLRFGVYVGGPLGTAIFDAPEGHDEAAWLGYTAFDPRPVSADVAAFRTAVRQMFGDASAPPHTLLIVADARPPGEFFATRRASSVLLSLGVAEPWSAPVRIAAAAEILHGWIGTQLWVGPTEPEAEAYWFTEGLTRHLARDLLFRFGLISPAELLDEVHGLAALAATSPHRDRALRDLAAHAKDPGVLPLIVARGALYATRTAALLRKKAPPTAAPGVVGAGAPDKAPARALEDVLRALLAAARARRGPLPTAAWIDALSAALGPGEAAAFRDIVELGAPARLPDGALGPCFRAARRRYEAFDLGFDLDATRAAPERRLAGLRAGGPAARAGARGGDALVTADFSRGRTDVAVKLTIEREGARKTFTYRPVGHAADGPGWARIDGIDDESCAR